jgi:FkbM family methyltransferase
MSNLIFDIGVGSGQDTYFYLNKGFKVVAVEADPIQFDHLHGSFAKEIADGSLTLINAVAGSVAGSTVKFYRNEVRQYTSSLLPTATGKEYEVMSVDYPTLINHYGVPYYCKVDIEGEDVNFLPKTDATLPTYLSIEVGSVAGIARLYQLGYRKFKLINQFYTQTLYTDYVYTGTFGNTATEGSAFSGKFPTWLNLHGIVEWSGLFGKELGGEWYTYEEITKMYAVVQNIHSKFPGEISGGHNAYDCHATV